MSQRAKTIILQGQENCRDLGGLINQRGQRIQYNKLFRSGQLNTLTPQDLQILQQIGLSQTIDFRSQDEAQTQPNCAISSLTSALHLPISAGNLAPKTVGQLFTSANQSIVEDFFMALYQDLICHTHQQYHDFFTALLNHQESTTLFHCTAGKDRTGVATALLLSALGMNQTTIMQDYLLSNQYQNLTKKAVLQYFPNPNPTQLAIIDTLLMVKTDFLQHAFHTIQTHYHSMDHYLHHVLDVDCHRLQQAFLENH